MSEQWHVLPGGIRQTVELSPTGYGFHDVEEIAYRIDSGPAQGQQGTVRVPRDLATPDAIKQTVDAEVDRLTSIASLGH